MAMHAYTRIGPVTSTIPRIFMALTSRLRINAERLPVPSLGGEPFVMLEKRLALPLPANRQRSTRAGISRALPPGVRASTCGSQPGCGG